MSCRIIESAMHIKLLLLLALSAASTAAISCATPTVNITGSVTYPLETKIAPPEIPKPRKGAYRIAFLPFQNTAQLVTQMDTSDLVYINNKWSAEIIKMSLDPEYKIVKPLESQYLMSEYDCVTAYSVIIMNYYNTGMVDQKAMRKILKKIDVDILIQGVLENFKVEDNVFIEASVRFFAFEKKTGGMTWNMRVHLDGKPKDLRKHERKTDYTLSLIGFGVCLALTAVGIGLTVDGLTNNDNIAEWTIGLGLASGTAVLIPFVFMKGKKVKTNNQAIVDEPPTMEEGVQKIIKASVDKIAANFGWQQKGDVE